MTQCCNQDCNQGRTCPLRTGKAQDQHARIAQLEALLKFADERINGLLAQLAAAPQGGDCARSHPHEEMTPMCELRTEIAHLTNELARAQAQHAAAPAHPAEAVPAQPGKPLRDLALGVTSFLVHSGFDTSHLPASMGAALRRLRDAAIAATHPTQQGLEQAVAAERERICAAIKTEDDHCVDQGDYMLDSNDCIKIVRGEWVRPDFAVDSAQAKKGGA